MELNDFLYILKESRNDEYELVSEFKNLRTTIEIRCKKCGHIFTCLPRYFIKGMGNCPVCKNGKIRTTSDLKDRISYITNGEFSVLGEYLGQETPVLIKHNTCGKIFEITPHTFLSRQNCPDCYKLKLIKNNKDWYLNEIKNKHGDGWVLLDKFEGMTKKIRHLHSCGFIINTSPYLFLRNKHNCIKCSDYQNPKKKSNEEYQKEIFEEFNGEYEPVDDYINAITKIKVKHICGCIFEVSPHKLFTRHTLCPQCNSSKGESKIYSFLVKHNINFKKEYCFEDCKNQKMLPFDFAVFGNDNNLKTLIEYDGEQHFKPIEYFGGEAGFASTIKRDNIKTNYCKQNNIKLLRIKYTDYENIDAILSKELL